MMTQDDAPTMPERPDRTWSELLAACHDGRMAQWAEAAGTPVAADLSGLSPKEAAQSLWHRYAPLARPVGQGVRVIAQLGQSLDGRIATPTGHSHYVTGPADRAHLHRLRTLSEAVLVGAGTVMADDPRLTVREVTGPQPIRVVSAGRAGIDPQRAIFRDGMTPTWAVAPAAVSMPAVDRRIHPADMTPASILAALAEAGIRRLLVEGGAKTVSAWLAAGLVDHLYLTVSPVIIGSGPTGLQLPAISHMDEAWRPPTEQFALGEDRLYRLDFTGASG
ncbi:RibD family protein [Spiribacter onubensis]|uniref:RibD family protein n=1 Tax=Spiribacter onubensis TaxID=3122420 RepID=A0ABV3S6C4_9GAMM